MPVQPAGLGIASFAHQRFNKYTEYALRFLGTCLVFLMTVDTIANNWEIMDTFQDGSLFRTPVLKAHNLKEVTDSVAFHEGTDPEHLSSTGFWLTEQIIEEMINHRDWLYMLYGGTYLISESTLTADSSVFAHHSQDYCVDFLGRFPYHTGNDMNDIRLGYVRDGVSMIHGYWINDEHFTIELDATNYREKNFHPIRFSIDLRMSSYFHPRFSRNARKTSGSITLHVYRIHSKTFCSGCTGMAEVGLGECEVEYTVDLDTNILAVTSSHAPKESQYRVGVCLQKSFVSIFSEILRFGCFLLVSLWYLSTRKTYRWELTALVKATDTPMIKVLKDLMAPKTFNFASNCTNIGLFCINSDLIVFMYSFSTLIDEYNSIIYVREVILWQHTDPQFWTAIRLLAFDLRKLWWSLLLLKVIKFVVNLVRTNQTLRSTRLQAFLTFTSGTSVYLLAIGLYYWPDIVEMINNNRKDLFSLGEALDDIHISFVESYYMRTFPFLVTFLLLNLFLCLAIDKLIWGKMMSRQLKNSFTLNLICNSTAITTDFAGMAHVGLNDWPTLDIPSRQFVTLMWYLRHHVRSFGLMHDSAVVKRASSLTEEEQMKRDAAESFASRSKFEVRQTNTGLWVLVDQGTGKLVSDILLNIRIRDDAILSIT